MAEPGGFQTAEASTRSNNQATVGRVTMLGNFEAVKKMSESNFDTATKAFEAVSKTTKEIADEIAEYSKLSFESGSEAMQKLFTVASFDKAVEVQSDYMRSAYEAFTARATKLGGLYANLGKEVFKPFQANFTNGTTAK